MLLRSSPMFAYMLRLYAAAGDPPAGGESADQTETVEEKPTTLTEDAGAEDDGEQGGGEEQTEEVSGEEPEKVTDSTTLLPDNDPATGSDQRDPNAWKDKEIRRKHTKLKQTESELQQARQELEEKDALLERLSRGEKPDATTTTTTRPAALDANDPAVQEAARRITDQRTFEQQLNEVNTKGEKDYGAKWNEALENLQTVGPLDADTTAAVMATDNPSKVMYELGAKPELYHELMELPIAKRLARMVRIADAVAPAGKKISGAPAPSSGTPIQGRGPSDTNSLDDKVRDDEWFARRDKQVDNKFRKRA